MARLVTSGGEIQDHPATDVGSPDGYTPGIVPTTTDTTNQRGGRACWSCAGTTTNTSFRAFPFTAPASGQTVYARAYVRVDVLPPSGAKKVAALLTSADGALISARLTSTGTFQLWNDAGSAQIGSDSTTVIATGTYYRVQLRLKIGAGAVDEAELRVQLDDSQAPEEIVATGATLTVSDTHTARFRAGWIDAPGATATMLVDGVGVNDSTGTKQTSWPGDGIIVLARATRSSWTAATSTDCSGAAPDAGGVNMAEGLNNTPPRGVADHTTAGHAADPDQIRSTSTSTTKVWCEPYSTLGIVGDTYFDIGIGSVYAAIGTGVNTAAIDGDQVAQKFQVNGTLESFKVFLYKVGAPTDNAIIYLTEDDSGQPGQILNQWTLPGPGMATSGLPLVFTLPQAVACNRPMWIVFGRDGAFDATNYYKLSTNAVEFLWNGSSWAVANQRAGTWTAATTTNVEAWFYTTQGPQVAKVMTAWICHGEAIATGTKTITVYSVTTGGSASASATANVGNDAGAAGTYPTLWTWTPTPVLYPSTSSTSGQMYGGERIGFTLGSATRFSLMCFAGVYMEFPSYSASGWGRYQKTADSTIWWAKQAPSTLTAEVAGGGTVTADPGSWIVYPDPQVTAGGDIPATAVIVADNTFGAGYTPA
jgi:hypothetical protein